MFGGLKLEAALSIVSKVKLTDSMAVSVCGDRVARGDMRMDEAKQKSGWKEKAKREFIRYWINVAYLGIFFGLFAWYRRLILAHYEIEYLKYGVAIIEAMVLAKVVMIGDMVGLGRKLFEDRPLIYPVLYKSILFSFFVGLFAIAEGTIDGLLKGKGWTGWLVEVQDEGKYEFLARCLMVFVAFIPYFAFKELANMLGEGKLGKLFLRNRRVLAE